MAKLIWCETGRKADIRTAKEKFCLETGKCTSGDKRERDDATTVATVATTAAVKGVIKDRAPHLSSSNNDNEEEEEDANVDADVNADVNAHVDADIDTDVKGEVIARKRNTPAPHATAQHATAATVSASKRSHLRALSSDFLEAFQLSFVQDGEARERDWQDQLDAWRKSVSIKRKIDRS